MPGGEREAAGHADRQWPIVPAAGRPLPPGQVLQREVHERGRNGYRDDAAKCGSPSGATPENRDHAGDGEPEHRSVGTVAQLPEGTVGEPPLLSRQARKQTPVEVIKDREGAKHEASDYVVAAPNGKPRLGCAARSPSRTSGA